MIRQEIQNYWTALLALLYNHHCAVCRTPLPLKEEHVCKPCLSSISFLPSPLCPRCAYPLAAGPANFCPYCLPHSAVDRAFALTPFAGTVQILLRQVKFSNKPWLLKKFFPLLETNPIVSLQSLECDGIVPMPLSWSRQWERGFNQSLLISQLIRKVLKKPLLTRAIQRRNKSPQARLSRKERLTKQEGAFKIFSPNSIRNKELLLVDDVLTTGSTAHACAEALKKAGARKITVFTLARTLSLPYQIGVNDARP